MAETEPAGNADWPKLSVIVPVRNGASTITACLDALLAQDYPGPPPHLIVIDNDSTDTTPEILARYQDRVELLNEPKRGASAARNAGVRHASDELIAMTDADCIPNTDWLASLVECARTHPQAALIGGCIIAADHCNTISRFAESFFDQRQAVEGYARPYVITANALARRSELLRVGLFNESFPRGQDVELSYRAHLRHNARLIYCQQAVVAHVNVNTLPRLIRKGLQHGASSAMIRREFQAEIGAAPTERLKQWAPYRDALVECLHWLGRLANPFHRPTDPDRDVPLYSALFRAAKQLSYTYFVLRPKN